jgi:hypothetical protein
LILLSTEVNSGHSRLWFGTDSRATLVALIIQIDAGIQTAHTAGNNFFLEAVASFLDFFSNLNMRRSGRGAELQLSERSCANATIVGMIMCQLRLDFFLACVIDSERLQNCNSSIPIEQHTFQSAAAHARSSEDCTGSRKSF